MMNHRNCCHIKKWQRQRTLLLAAPWRPQTQRALAGAATEYNSLTIILSMTHCLFQNIRNRNVSGAFIATERFKSSRKGPKSLPTTMAPSKRSDVGSAVVRRRCLFTKNTWHAKEDWRICRLTPVWPRFIRRRQLSMRSWTCKTRIPISRARNWLLRMPKHAEIARKKQWNAQYYETNKWRRKERQTKKFAKSKQVETKNISILL
mmetsp:Transcript_24381/g.56794  ORF Transcript_24381/g.56794 Transcript_24381/m.56794 type:complete len:205 (+) Transcript_24381:128-742(+)